MAEEKKEEVLEEVLEDLEAEDAKKQEEAQNTASEEKEVEAEEKTEDTESEPEEIEKEDEEKKKGIFKKKDLTDRLKRQMAEFENFRKRTEKEKSQMYDMGASAILEKILPVIDNFERGLAAVPEEDKNNGFVEGMDKIYKQMMTVLTEVGVTPIEAAGQEFDPNLHNAVMHVEDEELGENVVAEELQKGYKYKENVIRHSMVKVAN